MDPTLGIGYVRLTSFNEDSFVDFLAALKEMRVERKLNGLVWICAVIQADFFHPRLILQPMGGEGRACFH